MVDKFTDPLLTAQDTARHLLVPSAAVYRWLNEQVNGGPLVHGVRPEKGGWPCLPFIAVVEAYVLRSLRDLGRTKRQIRDAAADARQEFDSPYGLATDRIANDGVDILIRHADDDIRECIGDCLKYITWDEVDGFPSRLRLRQYPDIAPVVIDPRFGWGAPVVESTKVPLGAVVDLWLAGESLEGVAYEYDMTREQVEAICRTARRAA